MEITHNKNGEVYNILVDGKECAKYKSGKDFAIVFENNTQEEYINEIKKYCNHLEIGIIIIAISKDHKREYSFQVFPSKPQTDENIINTVKKQLPDFGTILKIDFNKRDIMVIK